MTLLHDEGQALVTHLWDGLSAVPGVRLYGPPPDRPRTATVSFSVDGFPSGEVARQLANEGIFVSNGDFYASVAVARLGLGGPGLVRVGCACYTTVSDVDRLIHSVTSLRD
jgi:selenocysteine lyase/cysteine desulfurase